jgi:hypothetical protein
VSYLLIVLLLCSLLGLVRQSRGRAYAGVFILVVSLTMWFWMTDNI